MLNFIKKFLKGFLSNVAKSLGFLLNLKRSMQMSTSFPLLNSGRLHVGARMRNVKGRPSIKPFSRITYKIL